MYLIIYNSQHFACRVSPLQALQTTDIVFTASGQRTSCKFSVYALLLGDYYRGTGAFDGITLRCASYLSRPNDIKSLCEFVLGSLSPRAAGGVFAVSEFTAILNHHHG